MENLPNNGNKGAINFIQVAAKVDSKCSKYCSILYAVPTGSTALTQPEKTNNAPQKFCKNYLLKIFCDSKNKLMQLIKLLQSQYLLIN